MTVAAAKTWLRMTGDADDSVIEMLLYGATEEVEAKLLDRYLMPRTVDLFLDAWPSGHEILLPAPLREVTALTWYDAEGQAHVVDAGSYVVSAAGPAPALIASNWPGSTLREADAVVVRCAVGYADVDAVPARYKHLVLALLAVDFANRDGLAVDAARARDNVVMRLLGERRMG